MCSHDPRDQRLGGGTQAQTLATSMWFGGELAGGAVPTQQLLDKRAAHPKDAGEDTLRAELTLISMEDFWRKSIEYVLRLMKLCQVYLTIK